MSLSIPDLLEPIVGFKHLRRSTDGFMSPIYVDGWGGRERVALCEHRELPAAHTAPDEGCTCGLYAWYGLPVVRYPDSIGVVEASGKIILHEAGFRSERMKLVAILSDDEDAFDRKAAEKIGVPYIDSRDVMARWRNRLAGLLLDNWQDPVLGIGGYDDRLRRLRARPSG